MTLAGEALQVGQPAPDFTLHAFEDGQMNTVTKADLAGKPAIVSVVPSLDTPVCQTQTKNFNQHLAGLGDQVNALFRNPERIEERFNDKFDRPLETILEDLVVPKEAPNSL